MIPSISGTLITMQYQDPDAARSRLEKVRWPEGPVCPHCGAVGQAHALKGRTTRKGLRKCSACRKPFTVTVGTVLQGSHVPLEKWLLAIHLMCASKRGVSAHELMRDAGIGSYRTAWFMVRRIRWALSQDPLASCMKARHAQSVH
jgi:transposase-like protein